MYSKNLTTVTGNITPYMTAAIYYLIVTLPLIKVVSIVEKRLARSEAGGGPRPKGGAAKTASAFGESEEELTAGASHMEAKEAETSAILDALSAPFRTHTLKEGLEDA